MVKRLYNEDGTVQVERISDKENPANLFTKALPLVTFDKVRRNIGLHPRISAHLAVYSAFLITMIHDLWEDHDRLLTAKLGWDLME
jgi:hypothetical protein